MDIIAQQDQVEVLVDEPTVNITVAAGIDGRRGSYFFVGSAANPNFVTDDSVITGNPDISVMIYDVYYSVTTLKQWQYLIGSDGNPQWYAFPGGSTGGGGGSGISSFKQNVDTTSQSSFTITHNLNTLDVIVTVYAVNVPRIDVGTYVERVNENTVNVKLQTVAGVTNYTVLIIAV